MVAILQDTPHTSGDPGHLADHAVIARLLNLAYQVVAASPASGGTYRPDVAAGGTHVVSLAGPVTIGAVQSTAGTSEAQFYAGQRLVVIIVQDATGNRAVTWDASYGGTPLVTPTALSSSRVEFVNTAATGAVPAWQLLSPDAQVQSNLYQLAGSAVGASVASTQLATSIATTIGTSFTDITGSPLAIAPNVGLRTVEHEIVLSVQPAGACTLIAAVFDGTSSANLGTTAETITAGGFRKLSCKVAQTPGAGVRSIRPKLALLSGSTAVTVYGVDINTLISSVGTVQR